MNRSILTLVLSLGWALGLPLACPLAPLSVQPLAAQSSPISID